MASTLNEEPPPPALGSRARRPPKRFIEPADSGTASKRAKPAQLVCQLPASSWVSCDNCKKWRRVAQEPTADEWCCSDNLDAKHSTCNVPQELSNADIDRELELAQEAAKEALLHPTPIHHTPADFWKPVPCYVSRTGLGCTKSPSPQVCY